jgi:hypothetical protein
MSTRSRILGDGRTVLSRQVSEQSKQEPACLAMGLEPHEPFGQSAQAVGRCLPPTPDK